MRKHFYHVYAGPKCQGSGKSPQHYQTQIWISKLLRNQNAVIEHPFPEIKRVADVYWPEKKIVFEVQYSPISFTEMAERNRDYASLGIYTLWILHARIFSASAHLERNLVTIPHYFTNINASGQGYIYDQFHTENGPTLPYIVNLAQPYRLTERPKFLPKSLDLRFRNSRYCFEGDLLFQAQRSANFMPRLRKKPLSIYHKWINNQIRTFNLG